MRLLRPESHDALGPLVLERMVLDDRCWSACVSVLMWGRPRWSGERWGDVPGVRHFFCGTNYRPISSMPNHNSTSDALRYVLVEGSNVFAGCVQKHTVQQMKSKYDCTDI